MSLAITLAESGRLPDAFVRIGIRQLLRRRLSKTDKNLTAKQFIEEMDKSPVAIHTDDANDQHYMLPPEFFQLVLGPNLKYSCCEFGTPGDLLEDAEIRMLCTTCDRAGIKDGMRVLDLGCGWGSLGLFIARTYPGCTVHCVSNSSEQRHFIEGICEREAITNLRVTTADINAFEPDAQFDRIVSVEMFEHIRNHREVLNRIAQWLTPDGKLFVHIFCHDKFAYAYESEGAGNWMGRYFFTGGTMPSFDLLANASDAMRQVDSWKVSGLHYAHTCRAWLDNMDRQRGEIMPVLERAYGDEAELWFQRWRMFFMACEELFAYNGGDEWYVGHFLLEPTRK